MYSKFFKRVLDVALSALAILILWPFLIIIAIIVKLDSPGPALFKQERVGKNKKTFYMLKFRTMKTDAPHDMPTHLLHDSDKYISRAGRILRKYSLDELMQLFNIFLGSMSIIGPRPALPRQEDLLLERDKYGANDIRPGLTGWAQVNGRDELETSEKAALDGEYVKNMSFTFDVKCIIKTVGSVVRCDGVAEGGSKIPEKEVKVSESIEKIKRGA